MKLIFYLSRRTHNNQPFFHPKECYAKTQPSYTSPSSTTQKPDNLPKEGIVKRLLSRINKILKREHGFTLVEMVTVVAIMSVMAAVAVPMANDQLAKTRDPMPKTRL